MEIWSLKEVAEFLRIHPTTIYRLIRQKRFPGAFKVGSDWRFDAETIKAWVKSQQVAA